MTHGLPPKPVAGAVDTNADDIAELKWELDEDRVRRVISFPFNPEWSPVGAIEDLCIWGCLYFDSIVGP